KYNMYLLILKIIINLQYYYAAMKTWFLLKAYKKQLQTGKDCAFSGTPIIKVAKKSYIQFGNNCLINSSYQSNPAGVMMPCVFATIRNDAVIKIGNNVGVSGVSIVAATKITIEDDVSIGAG